MRRIALFASLALATLIHVPSAAAGLIVWAKNPSSSSPASFQWGEIWVANDDGTKPRPLLRPQGRLPGIPMPFSATRLSAPRLSPDGKSLTFTAQWNRLWFSGQATSCGVGCQGVYQLKGGVIRRLSPAPPKVSLNGCPGAATFDLCETFESDAVPLGTSVLYLSRVDTWVGCPPSGCRAAPTDLQDALDIYTPKAGGGFKRTNLVDWNAPAPDGCGGEPQNVSFDANTNGMVFTHCGADVSLTDFRQVVPIAHFYVPPMHISFRSDGRRVLAANGRPGSNDPADVWSFSATTGADAKTPSDYLIAIRNRAQWSFNTPIFAGTRFIVSGASDGNLWRFPAICGAPGASGRTCTVANATRITNDAKPKLYPGSGDPFFSSYQRYNSDPGWTKATAVGLGTKAAPRVSAVLAFCNRLGGVRCQPTVAWTANAVGKVAITVSRGTVKLGTVTLATPAGPNGALLPARIGGKALVRGATYRFSVVLIANGKRSAAVAYSLKVR